MFVVLAKRDDCGDVAVLPVEKDGNDFWKTFSEARAVMKADYQAMSKS